jgi:hypothetical protein
VIVHMCQASLIEQPDVRVVPEFEAAFAETFKTPNTRILGFRRQRGAYRRPKSKTSATPFANRATGVA